MDEYDLLDDIFTQPTEKSGTRALSKFQPKAKKKIEQPRLPPTSTVSTISNVSEPNVVISSNEQSVKEVSNNEDCHGISNNSFTSDGLITVKDDGLHSKKDKPQNEVELSNGDQQQDKTHSCESLSYQTKEPVVILGHLQTEAVNGCDNMELDTDQGVDLFSTMDQFDDFNTQETTCAARNLDKFKPKGKMISKQQQKSVKSNSSILSSTDPLEGPNMGLCTALSVDKTSKDLLNESSVCIGNSQTKPQALSGPVPESFTQTINENTCLSSVLPNDDVFYPESDSHIRIPDSSSFWESEDPTCSKTQEDHIVHDQEDLSMKNTALTLLDEGTEDFQNTELHMTDTNVGDATSVEGGPNSRRLTKKAGVHSPVYEFDDEDSIDFGINESLHDVRNDDDDDDYTGKEPGIKKQTRKRAKTSSSENPKIVEESRKSLDDGHSTKQEAPKKKFPHSTRRKRRQVSMELLATPDEEIDERRLPLKDLILLTEAREKMAIKDQFASKQSSAKKSYSPGLGNHIFGEDMYSKGQYPNHDDEEEDEIDADDELCQPKFNHHSFMKKKSSSKWSKLDTSLFYQAIRQFGTDFSMVQQLFPDRTRHQIKLKFNNEDRKHPLQIADALFHRPKDVSQFERVIRQLEAQKTKNPDDDDTTAEDQAAVAPESQDTTATWNENPQDEENEKPEYREEHDVSDDLKYSEYQDVFDFSELGDGDIFYTGKDEDYGI